VRQRAAARRGAALPTSTSLLLERAGRDAEGGNVGYKGGGEPGVKGRESGRMENIAEAFQWSRKRRVVGRNLLFPRT